MKTPILHCVDFQRFKPGSRPNPDLIDDVHFEVFGPSSRPELQTEIRSDRGFNGLDSSNRLEIRLPEQAAVVELHLVASGVLGDVQAFNESGSSVGRADIKGKMPEIIRLVGEEITQVRVTAPSKEILLLEFCYFII